jgi:hypothetical protein
MNLRRVGAKTHLSTTKLVVFYMKTRFKDICNNIGSIISENSIQRLNLKTSKLACFISQGIKLQHNQREKVV